MKAYGIRLKVHIHLNRRWVSQKPLNILFFGSDEFSSYSLKELKSIQDTNSAIDKLQLVVRPAKWCGRHRSTLKYPSIVNSSKGIGLPPPLLCESKEDWINLREIIAKENYNMIVAVSFGKLIPRNLLENVQYSLNVHPSLLPRYKGASPIQSALMNGDEFTGVTVQTLDPFKFDNGKIVAQTEPLRINELLARGTISHFTSSVPINTAILMDQLGLEGATLLRKVITKGLYRHPQDTLRNWKPSYASKITPGLKQIEWNRDTAQSLLNKLHAIGPLFTYKEVQGKKDGNFLKRVIFHKFEVVSLDNSSLSQMSKPGDFFYNPKDESIYVLCNQSIDNTHNISCLIKVKELQFEGYQKELAKKFMTSFRKRCGSMLSQNMAFSSQ